MIGISGGNQRKHSVSSKRMGKMSSLSIVTMIGLIVTTIVALSCLNAYRKLSAPIGQSLTLTTLGMKVIDTDKKQIKLKSLKESEHLIDSKSIKEKDEEKEQEKNNFKEKERNQDKNEEISDENMELIEKETKKTKTNLRQGVQKDFLKNEDRKSYQNNFVLSYFINYIFFFSTCVLNNLFLFYLYSEYIMNALLNRYVYVYVKENILR